MATDYRDDTAFTDTDHTMAQIAEAIRHKKYGKDVREAIAQGFELMYKKINEIEGDTSDGTSGIQAIERRLTERINRIVVGQDNETTRQIVEQILREKGVI